MMRDLAPAAMFYRITVGPADVVMLVQMDRVSRAWVEREFFYWQGLFGDLARLDVLTCGEDIVVRHMATAIQSLSKDGAGVTPAVMMQMGFAADVVARRFADALALVIASLPQEPREALPDTVVRLIQRPEAAR